MAKKSLTIHDPPPRLESVMKFPRRQWLHAAFSAREWNRIRDWILDNRKLVEKSSVKQIIWRARQRSPEAPWTKLYMSRVDKNAVIEACRMAGVYPNSD